MQIPGDHMRSRKLALPFVSFLALAALPAHSQEADAPTPSRSTEAYQSWTVESTNLAVAAEPAEKPAEAAEAKPADAKKPADAAADAGETKRICEAAQVFTNRKTGNEIARLVFALDPKGTGGLVAGMRTVVDVSFEKGPALVDGDAEISTGKVTRCNGTYCFALFDIDDAKIEQFLKTSKPGVQYPIASGQMLRINMSTAGLSDALAALKTKK
jgi:invasion protein IalB